MSDLPAPTTYLILTPEFERITRDLVHRNTKQTALKDFHLFLERVKDDQTFIHLYPTLIKYRFIDDKTTQDKLNELIKAKEYDMFMSLLEPDLPANYKLIMKYASYEHANVPQEVLDYLKIYKFASKKKLSLDEKDKMEKWLDTHPNNRFRRLLYDNVSNHMERWQHVTPTSRLQT